MFTPPVGIADGKPISGESQCRTWITIVVLSVVKRSLDFKNAVFDGWTRRISLHPGHGAEAIGRSELDVGRNHKKGKPFKGNSYGAQQSDFGTGEQRQAT